MSSLSSGIPDLPAHQKVAMPRCQHDPRSLAVPAIRPHRPGPRSAGDVEDEGSGISTLAPELGCMGIKLCQLFSSFFFFSNQHNLWPWP